MDVSIHLKETQHRFQTGEKILGYAAFILPETVPISSISIAFRCTGEVKWSDPSGTLCLNSDHEYYSKYDYLELVYPMESSGLVTIEKGRQEKIPYQFLIPEDWNLPSSMISSHGFIQYEIYVTVKLSDGVKNFSKNIVVQAPMKEKLLIAVTGSAEKLDLLHTGKLSMQATIARKGYAPGEIIPVQVLVHNGTSSPVTPRISLRQIQIFMAGSKHKTIETTINKEAVQGVEVIAHADDEQLIEVAVPGDDSMSIKSALISVKYFLHVTLDVKWALDLHVNLPFILTTPGVIEEQKRVAQS